MGEKKFKTKCFHYSTKQYDVPEVCVGRLEDFINNNNIAQNQIVSIISLGGEHTSPYLF
jgi:hypothetical protein